MGSRQHKKSQSRHERIVFAWATPADGGLASLGYTIIRLSDYPIWSRGRSFLKFRTCVTLYYYSFYFLSLRSTLPTLSNFSLFLFPVIDAYTLTWHYLAWKNTHALQVSGTLRAINAFAFMMRSYQNRRWPERDSDELFWG